MLHIYILNPFKVDILLFHLYYRLIFEVAKPFLNSLERLFVNSANIY